MIAARSFIHPDQTILIGQLDSNKTIAFDVFVFTKDGSFNDTFLSGEEKAVIFADL